MSFLKTGLYQVLVMSFVGFSFSHSAMGESCTREDNMRFRNAKRCLQCTDEAQSGETALCKKLKGLATPENLRAAATAGGAYGGITRLLGMNPVILTNEKVVDRVFRAFFTRGVEVPKDLVLQGRVDLARTASDIKNGRIERLRANLGIHPDVPDNSIRNAVAACQASGNPVKCFARELTKWKVDIRQSTRTVSVPGGSKYSPLELLAAIDEADSKKTNIVRRVHYQTYPGEYQGKHRGVQTQVVNINDPNELKSAKTYVQRQKAAIRIWMRSLTEVSKSGLTYSQLQGLPDDFNKWPAKIQRLARNLHVLQMQQAIIESEAYVWDDKKRYHRPVTPSEAKKIAEAIHKGEKLGGNLGLAQDRITRADPEGKKFTRFGRLSTTKAHGLLFSNLVNLGDTKARVVGRSDGARRVVGAAYGVAFGAFLGVVGVQAFEFMSSRNRTLREAELKGLLGESVPDSAPTVVCRASCVPEGGTNTDCFADLIMTCSSETTEEPSQPSIDTGEAK